jgi:hypothetical protein
LYFKYAIAFDYTFGGNKIKPFIGASIDITAECDLDVKYSMPIDGTKIRWYLQRFFVNPKYGSRWVVDLGGYYTCDKSKVLLSYRTFATNTKLRG